MPAMAADGSFVAAGYMFQPAEWGSGKYLIRIDPKTGESWIFELDTSDSVWKWKKIQDPQPKAPGS